ncbi:glycosyltransferase [Amphritea sp.]|uniref:glycosyltransferase n=1 Tax=Amphritea sp. TaxID=1872502 RepID=UPI003D0970E7
MLDDCRENFIRSDSAGKDSLVPIIFILSWNRPIYLWVCLDSIFRNTKAKCKVVIADNNSNDPMVRSVISSFEERGLFYKVYSCLENDPFRLKQLVDLYWDEIGDYFVFIESDIEIMPIKESCWLSKFTEYMDLDEKLGIVGSRVYQDDFVSKGFAKEIRPGIDESDLDFLIKSKAPMRDCYDTSESLISPHNPPLRLLMLRKKVYEKIGFGRDTQIHFRTIKEGYKSAISTEVVHRHLSLLNIFDYYSYSGNHRDAFFDKQRK